MAKPFPTVAAFTFVSLFHSAAKADHWERVDRNNPGLFSRVVALDDTRALVINGGLGFDPKRERKLDLGPDGMLDTPDDLLCNDYSCGADDAASDVNPNDVVDGVPPNFATEIFHLDTKTWSPAASPSAAHNAGIAITMGNGKVLLVGGLGGLILPADGDWSRNFPDGKGGLQPDGRDIMHGVPDGCTDICEVYDPGTNTWKTTDPIPCPDNKTVTHWVGSRTIAKVTSASGNTVTVDSAGDFQVADDVFIGRSIYDPSQGRSKITAKSGNDLTLDKAFTVDPGKTRIVKLTSVTRTVRGVYFEYCTPIYKLDKDRVMIVGGTYADKAEDPNNDGFYETPLIYHSSTRVYIYDDSKASGVKWSTSELINGIQPTVATLLYPLNVAAGAMFSDGKLILVGGADNDFGLRNDCSIYDPVTNTWNRVASLPPTDDPRSLLAGGCPDGDTLMPDPGNGGLRAGSAIIGLPGNRILVAGGYFSEPGRGPKFQTYGYRSSCLIYDLACDSWKGPAEGVGRLRRGSQGGLLKTHTGDVYHISGHDNAESTATVLLDKLDQDTLHWVPLADMPCRIAPSTNDCALTFQGQKVGVVETDSLALPAAFLASLSYNKTDYILFVNGDGTPSTDYKYQVFYPQEVPKDSKKEAILYHSTPTPIQRCWKPAASLNVARSSHTATLLEDGRVLIAGGFDGSAAALDSFEIYDPITETFLTDPTWKMPVACGSHSAASMPTGEVVLCGGSAGGTALDTIQIYDPETNSFCQTGKLDTARVGHTATVLHNGQVLIAGGKQEFPRTTAVLYDPLRCSSTNIAPNLFPDMLLEKSGHTATLLPCQVLLAEGNFGTLVDLLYDPVTQSFSEIPGAVFPLPGTTATLLLDGRVLIYGGDNEFRFASVRLYDPQTTTSSYVPPGGPVTLAHTATLLLDGRVLVAGGVGGEGCFVTRCRLFEPSTDTFSSTGALRTARVGHSATRLLNGDVLIVGGQGNGVEDPNTGICARGPALASCEMYTSCNTLKGQNVVVTPVDTTTKTTPVELTFSAITEVGITDLATNSTGPAPPAGFKLGCLPPTFNYFNLTTTATFTPPIEICIDYSQIQSCNPLDLKLFHYENSMWVELLSYLVVSKKMICGKVNSLSPFAVFEPEGLGPQFRRGDANADSRVDISDARRVLDFLFSGAEIPPCTDAADANDDGTIDISDGIVILGYLFLGTSRIPHPGPDSCGEDLTQDDLLNCTYPGVGCGP